VVTVFQNFYPFVVACWAVSETVFRIRVTIEAHTPVVPWSVRVLYVLRTFILVVCCHLVGSFSACFRYTYILYYLETKRGHIASEKGSFLRVLGVVRMF